MPGLVIAAVPYREVSRPAGSGVRAGVALRGVRAVLFALVCTGLAWCGHVLAGGGRPSAACVAAGFGMVFVVGLVALGRERGFGVITGGLLAGQFGLHALFMRADVAAMAAGHAHMSVLSGLTGWMIVLHVLAAGVTGGYLWFGESRVVSWRGPPYGMAFRST